MHHNTIYGAAPWTILRCLVSLTTVALMLLPSVGGVSASSKSASSNIMSIYPMRRRRPALSPRR